MISKRIKRSVICAKHRSVSAEHLNVTISNDIRVVIHLIEWYLSIGDIANFGFRGPTFAAFVVFLGKNIFYGLKKLLKKNYEQKEKLRSIRIHSANPRRDRCIFAKLMKMDYRVALTVIQYLYI